MNCRVIKNTLKCKICSDVFRFTQEPSSGSQSQCLAKITGIVPLCSKVHSTFLYGELRTRTTGQNMPPWHWQRSYRQAQWNHTCNFN